MMQGNWKRGLSFKQPTEHYTKAFHDGEFQNILYAMEKGLYDAEAKSKLKYRFRHPQFKPIFDDLIRLGHFTEEDRFIY